MGGAMSAAMGVIGGVIAFIIVKEVIGGVTTTSWGTLEYTLMVTLVPVVIAIGVMFIALRAFGITGSR